MKNTHSNPTPLTPGEAANVAMILFTATRPLHRLPARAARTLRVALQEDPARQGPPDDHPAPAEPGTVRLTRTQVDVAAAVWELVRPTTEEATRYASLKPGLRKEARILAALVQVAEALTRSTELPARLATINILSRAVVVKVAGPGAKAAARQAELAATRWQRALHRRLSVECEPPSDADLAQLAQFPVRENGPFARTMQRSLAVVCLDWLTAWQACRSGQPEAATFLLTATLRASQLIALYRPMLKRRPTSQLRAALAPLRRKLIKFAHDQAAADDILAYRNGQSRETAQLLANMANHASQVAQEAQADLVAWARSPSLTSTALRLRVFVSEWPMRRQFNEVVVADAAPRLLRDAAAHLAQRQLDFTASDPASWRRAAFAVLRLQAAITSLNVNGPADTAVAELLNDLGRAAKFLDALDRLDAVEQAVEAYLDRWAERQGRRKAPQMHGAEAVLDYRQHRRAERLRHLRALTEAWKPIRGRNLQRRVAAVGSSRPA